VIQETETSIVAVARYILEKSGQMTTMKLQKLCYYSQVWHSYQLDKKLFKETIRAWSYGPVSADLFDLHRGKYQILASELPATSSGQLLPESIGLIDKVLEAYGGFSGAQLSDLSHRETPWIETRALSTTADASPIISVEKMYEFAASLSDAQ
jgi:uncharacterized phage-associated protein